MIALAWFTLIYLIIDGRVFPKGGWWNRLLVLATSAPLASPCRWRFSDGLIK